MLEIYLASTSLERSTGYCFDNEGFCSIHVGPYTSLWHHCWLVASGDNPYVDLSPIALSEQSMSPAPWDSIKHAYSSRYSYNADLSLVNIDTPCTFEGEDTPCTDKQVDCIPLRICSLFYSLYSYTLVLFISSLFTSFYKHLPFWWYVLWCMAGFYAWIWYQFWCLGCNSLPSSEQPTWLTGSNAYHGLKCCCDSLKKEEEMLLWQRVFSLELWLCV